MTLDSDFVLRQHFLERRIIGDMLGGLKIDLAGGNPALQFRVKCLLSFMREGGNILCMLGQVAVIVLQAESCLLNTQRVFALGKVGADARRHGAHLEV